MEEARWAGTVHAHAHVHDITATRLTLLVQQHMKPKSVLYKGLPSRTHVDHSRHPRRTADMMPYFTALPWWHPTAGEPEVITHAPSYPRRTARW